MNLSLQDIIYSSGDVFLPENVKKILEMELITTSKKTFYVSGWSIIHFINGIIIGYIYLYFKWDSKFYFYKLFIIHTIWEFWQMLIGMSKPYKLTGRNNLIDIIMDTIFFMLGAYILLYIFYKLKWNEKPSNTVEITNTDYSKPKNVLPILLVANIPPPEAICK